MGGALRPMSYLLLPSWRLRVFGLYCDFGGLLCWEHRQAVERRQAVLPCSSLALYSILEIPSARPGSSAVEKQLTFVGA